MKKIFASILALAMLVCCLSVVAFAADAPTWYIDDFTAKVGDKLEIDLMIKDVPSTGISSGKIKVSCDAFRIVPESEDGGVFTGSWSRGRNNASQNEGDGLLNWAYTSNITNPAGQYLILTIEIKNVAPGKYPITITSSDIQVSTGENSFDKLEGGTTTAYVTVEGNGEEPPTPPADPTYSVAASASDYTKGSNAPVDFTVTADPADAPIEIKGVKVDGNDVPADKITVDGSKVTVDPSYLDTLGEGEHTVTVDLGNGTADTKINVKPEEVTPPQPQDPTYTVAAGNSDYTKGSDKGIDFTVTADPADAPIDVKGVTVDGNPVPADALTVDGGKVTVKPEYLDTLGEGEHTVAVDLGNGTAETKINVKPKEDEPNPPAKTEYELKLDSADYTKGSGKDLGVTVYTTAEDAKVNIDTIKIDGKELTNDDVYLNEDGTQIFIKADVLDKLDAGDHTIEFTFDDGETASASVAVKDASGNTDPGNNGENDKPGDNKDNNSGKKDDAAKTGDLTNLYIYIAICLFAAAAVVGTSYEVKKIRG